MQQVVRAAVVFIGCAGSTQAMAENKAVQLSGNPAQFFGSDAYPAEAMRLNQQGRVVARLEIDSTGKVVSCTVTESSRSPSLDQRTCEIALEKVVFNPARNKRGVPVAATYMLPVRWVLPSGPLDVGAYPPPSWTVDMTLSVDGGGIVSACNATVTPTPSGGTGPCDQFPVGSQSEFVWLRDGKPVGGVIKRHYGQEIIIDK